MSPSGCANSIDRDTPNNDRRAEQAQPWRAPKRSLPGAGPRSGVHASDPRPALSGLAGQRTGLDGPEQRRMRNTARRKRDAGRAGGGGGGAATHAGVMPKHLRTILSGRSRGLRVAGSPRVGALAAGRPSAMLGTQVELANDVKFWRALLEVLDTHVAAELEHGVRGTRGDGPPRPASSRHRLFL